MDIRAGRCFSPLMGASLSRKLILLFNGDINLLANREGENDLRSLEAADTFGDFLLVFVDHVGDRETTGRLLILT